ncbi:Ribulose-phosphate 3-epimerase [Fuerstiella marisgermanici]|uniref:Ribulose-phosphate 3-epimerase n=2 Tax=Fuerstiella marisgermanici TaxID=1891926 RepID=A0A1P8WC46_9PLAN|nr:Ribulose-phosphate 3-epimerase [Fuerstiella marisgermanici]
MLQHLRQHRPVIAPSMLKCDFGNLQAEVDRIDAANLPLYHWDVMDGHFVPNLSYGAMLIAATRKRTSTPFDVHLMISDPAAYVDEYVKAGCEAITFHLEAVPEPRELLQAIRKQDVVAGLAINPNTPFEAAEPFLQDCDLLLVMSVNPGFGGQAFMPEVLPKIQQARKIAGDELLISVDGGVAAETISDCAVAGADIFVAGSSIFDHDDYGIAGARLVSQAGSHVSATAKGS